MEKTGGQVAAQKKNMNTCCPFCSCKYHALCLRSCLTSAETGHVRVYMDQNPKWANPVKQLLRAKSVVKIDGRLLRFEQVSLVKSSALCVVIAAYDITYLVKPQQPSPSSGSGASTVATSQRKGNLRAKVQTQAESERSSQSQSTSSPVESQVKLGKRKANSSEDEVDDHV